MVSGGRFSLEKNANAPSEIRALTFGSRLLDGGREQKGERSRP